jgi:hexosaminidase
MPQSFLVGSNALAVDASKFQFVVQTKSQILKDALTRYLYFAFPVHTSASPSASAVLTSLTVSVSSDDETLVLGTDESYTLKITTDGSGTLTAATIYGAMRGLETFAQLVTFDYAAKTYSISNAPIMIQDAPRFAWRGFLLDTARHYLPVSFILHTIDALSFNKFNVLHWHIVDAQSFPLQSATYPKLTAAAWASDAIYTKDDVANIVAYAKARGIRVLPEFDTPGHAAAWGVGYPSLVANCPSYAANINNIPLNSASEDTFTFLAQYFAEILPLFPDRYVHIGGDEIVFGCWEEDAKIAAFLKAKNWQPSDLYNYHHQRILGLMQTNSRTPVGWEELFTEGAITSASDPTLIHVWANREVLAEVVAKGHQALLSAGWYLDKQIPGQPTEYEWENTWHIFYNNEPFMNGSTVLPPSMQKLILGGEAAMWGEQVDQANFDSRVWPRASAVAERLWSPMSVTDISMATPRLSEWRCKMVNRGIGAGPVMPEFCRRLI